MHLITPLASGIKGAESGTASIYVRGTSTRATYYNDFEAASAVSSGADVSLDANGGAEIYVNQYVDVVVKNTAGTTVREFTCGCAAPNVEYIGQSFTGVDYTTGVSGVSKPVNLQTILNSWKTSAGTTDFNVLLGGSSTTIQTALSTIYGVFTNVQSYGAVGDGVVDDTSAISTALDALYAAGGGILFFPIGDYRITTALPLKNNVSLFGINTDGTYITIDHATEGCFYYTGAGPITYAPSPINISGLRFRAASSANSGDLLSITGHGAIINIDNCCFGFTDGGSLNVETTNCIVNVTNCVFYPNDVPVAGCIKVSVESYNAAYRNWGWVTFNNCLFKFSDSQTTDLASFIRINHGTINGCIFDASNAVTASKNCIALYGGSDTTHIGVSITNNWFVGVSGYTTYAINDTFALGTEDWQLVESGNLIDSDTVIMYANLYHGYESGLRTHLGSRAGTWSVVTSNASPVSLDVANNEFINLNRTTNAAQTIRTTPQILPCGTRFTLVIHNDYAGVSGTITFDTSYFTATPSPFTIAQSRSRAFEFISAEVAGSQTLLCISDDGEFTD